MGRSVRAAWCGALLSLALVAGGASGCAMRNWLPAKSCGSAGCEGDCQGDCDACDAMQGRGPICKHRGNADGGANPLASELYAGDTLPGRFHPVPTRPVFGLVGSGEVPSVQVAPAPVRLMPPRTGADEPQESDRPNDRRDTFKPQDPPPEPLEARRDDPRPDEDAGTVFTSAVLSNFSRR